MNLKNVKEFFADVFHLYTDEQYNDLLNDYFHVLEDNQRLEDELESRNSSQRKIEKNIYRVGKDKYQVRIQLNGKRHQSKFLPSVEEAREFLKKIKEENNANIIQE